MVAEIFADGVGRVDFVSGVVRIELVSLEPAESGQGKMEVRQRIAMPVDGFLHSLNTMGDLVRRTGDDLLECKNFGVTSLNEVREKLTVLGLKLRGE